jgi:hypothetical protein
MKIGTDRRQEREEIKKNRGKRRELERKETEMYEHSLSCIPLPAAPPLLHVCP